MKLKKKTLKNKTTQKICKTAYMINLIIVLTGVTDNAKNVVNCWELLQKPWIPCLGHNLNLAAKKVMSVDTVSRVVAAVRRIVTHFHTSTLSANKLKEKQALLGIPEHKLIQDVETRWNSTHDMLARMLEQQVAVTAVMFEGSKSLKDLSLDARQVSVMEELVTLLSPLKEITAMMSSPSSVTVSIIAPTLNKIERFFQTNESDSKFVKDSICNFE